MDITADAAARLEFLRGCLRLPIHQHQSQSRHVDADTEHVRAGDEPEMLFLGIRPVQTLKQLPLLAARNIRSDLVHVKRANFPPFDEGTQARRYVVARARDGAAKL